MKLRLSPALFSLTATLLALAQNQPPLNLKQVIVVFKTHFDIGYTDMASNVVHRYRTSMIEQALRVVDQSRALPPEQQFAWTIPGWPLSQILEDWPGQTPERQQRVWAAFKTGRFVVHALPFTTHTELLELEDLVRGLGHAARLSRTAGLSLPRDAKMTDVPCHSWIMPTLLKHAGVDFLHLGCNAASSSPVVPRLFLWEGPDGSRLLTMYTAESYGTGLVPPTDWPYQTWLALIHTGDNHGPPTPEEVATLRAEARAKLPGVSVRIGRLSDFADAVLAENAPLPVVRGDMPDTWIHGPLCDPAGARLARTGRPLIATAAALDTQLRAWGVQASRAAPLIAEAWEQSLLYGEHTWGGAFSWIYGKFMQKYGDSWRQERAAGQFRRSEDSWAEHTAYIQKTRALVDPLLEGQLRALAGAVDRGGKRVVVFNPLPWRRSGMVTFADSGHGGVARAEGDRKANVARTSDGPRQLLAVDIPPSGYRTYALSDEASAASGPYAHPAEGKLQTPRFTVGLDPARGTVKSIQDRRSGRELVDAKSEHGFGQFLYERFSKNEVEGYVKAYVKINADWATNELGKPTLPPASEVPYRAMSPAHWKLRFEQSPSHGVAVMESAQGDGLPAVTTRVTVYGRLPYVDLEVTVHDKPADPWPEAGWLCLPFAVDGPRFHVGRLGSIIDPAKDIVPGANCDLMGINTGLAITDANRGGVGLCPLDSPLVSLGRPGCWRYTRPHVPERAAVYVNLFNNQWSTNFRLWNEGTWTWRVRVWAIDRFRPERDLVVPSLEARNPLVAAVADGPGGRLPATQSGLEVSRRGVQVTAFNPNPDGVGTVLRLWELAGQGGKCRVSLPKGLEASQAQPMDLRGQPHGTPIPIQKGKFAVDLRPFAPCSLKLETARAAQAALDR